MYVQSNLVTFSFVLFVPSLVKKFTWQKCDIISPHKPEVEEVERFTVTSTKAIFSKKLN